MIYINGFGYRLGNQLFQIAAAIGLAKKYNDEVSFPDWPYARYFTGEFNTVGNLHDRSIIYNEKEFHYNEIPYTKDMGINGYFQSERYFEHCKKYVKSQLKPVPIPFLQEIAPNSCFIHVRRGDYVGLQDNHPLQTWDNYYAKAVERMENWYPAKYYVFSDDIRGVKDEFPDRPDFEYVIGNDEISDFYLMTKCQYAIIGNSSYSWWSAYLSEYKNQQVIAPSNWFGPAYWYHDTRDLYPNGWMKI